MIKPFNLAGLLADKGLHCQAFLENHPTRRVRAGLTDRKKVRIRESRITAWSTAMSLEETDMGFDSPDAAVLKGNTFCIQDSE